MSVNPDVVLQTKRLVAQVEQRILLREINGEEIRLAPRKNWLGYIEQ